MGNAASLAPRIGIVLSGGGARGAYEAGVLSFLLEELPARLGRPVHFDVITGTSVGAVHACWLAASQEDPGAGARLLGVWRSLTLAQVFALGVTDLVRVPWRLLNRGVGRELPGRGDVPERLAGLFDTGWLEEIVLRDVSWRALRASIDAGRLAALAIAATEIETGRSVVFIDTPSGRVPQWARDPFVVARPTRIGPPHALASAAIPIAFPAVRIGSAYYCDGGLRLNTPLAPALRLGVDRVLVIGLRHHRSPGEEDRAARGRQADYNSPFYMAGKALNALLLDRIEYDLDRLRLFNGILEAGVAAYGPAFLETVNEPIIAQRGAPYRVVRELALHPSEDLGAIAADCLRHQGNGHGLRDRLSRGLVRQVGRGILYDADLLSYLLFDRCYADHLIDLGRRDAAAAADDLAAFLD